MIGAATFLPLSWPSLSSASVPQREMRFDTAAKSTFGDWSASVALSQGYLQPGSLLTITTDLILSAQLLSGLTTANIHTDEYLLLITSERCFDSHGWMRLPADERMSTLLTPTGIAIEGGNSGAVSKYIDSRQLNPIDEMLRVPTSQAQKEDQGTKVSFGAQVNIPQNIPPGIYRLRFDLGVIADKRRWSLNKEGFANRQKEAGQLSSFYSLPMLCSNKDNTGTYIDATAISPKMYWGLLGYYNSNGYQGVIADEDKDHFALSSRNIIPDEVILPMYNPGGNKISYSLEPAFPTDTIDKQRNIPLNYACGELSIQITDPAGKTTDLGTSPYTGAKGEWPTTGNPQLTAWKPPLYGRYTVACKGWVGDEWGNRYHGGGTYHFWIAKRMTMGTATFQGMAYPVGTRYGKDIGFSPAVPADVSVNVSLYPNSDASKAKTLVYSGKATAGGIFGPAQGMKAFALEAPGEYHAHIFASYTDSEGHLWVCSMRHAGVVYPEDTILIAHGKKVKVNDEYFDRGETHKEGYIETNDNFRHLEHINYPYNSGDVLLIASEGQGANKIEPVLTYEIKGANIPYDKRLNSIGATNVQIATSNGLSPHLYPEFITDMAYYYAAAPRPGFPSRFIVGENGVRSPYWPTSGSNFGGQIGASNNGDSPGDIYRLIGGLVLRRSGEQPLYAGYMANAFILPKGTNNNRVIAPGSEDLTGADGRLARFFMVPIRPGMVFDQGAVFVPVLQIDPMVPAHIAFVLQYPDGTQKKSEGTGDKFGYFVGTERWQLDQPGVYQYSVKSDWQGFEGKIPGLTPGIGYIFVLDKKRPMDKGVKLALKTQQTFPVLDGLLIEGTTTAAEVYYTIITPGAVIEQGKISAVNGRFFYRFDPAGVNQKIPIYDIENHRNGHKDIGRVIHLTVFSAEKAADGTTFHSYARVILRGNTAIYAT